MYAKWPGCALLLCALLAVACGDSGGPDVIDAGPATIDAAPGVVAVTTRIHGIGVPNVVILIHADDEAERMITGEDGTVEVTVDAAVDVTAIFATEGERTELVSLLEVQPGTSLDIERPGGHDPTPVASADIVLPGAQAGATQYDVTLGCVGGLYDAPADYATPIATFEVPSACVEDNAIDTVALAVDTEALPEASGLVAFAARQRDVSGGDISFDFPDWSTGWLEFDITVDNLPADTASVTSFARVFKGRRGYPGPNLYTQELSMFAGDTVTASHRVPSGFGESTVSAEIALRRRMPPDDATTYWRQAVERDRAADVTVDATSQLAPDLTAAELDLDINSFTPTMTWKSPSNLSSMSTGWLFLNYGGEAHWRIAFPPNRLELALPILPTEDSPGFEPTSSTVSFIKCASASNYREFLTGYCPFFGFPGRTGDPGTVSWTSRSGLQ